MTDPEYHAAFHAMMISFIVVPDPTGAGMIPRIAEWSRRGAAEREVAARVMREIYECDGSSWDAHDAAHWYESEGVAYDAASSLAGHD